MNYLHSTRQFEDRLCTCFKMEDEFGLIPTIGENDDIPTLDDSSDTDEEAVKVKKKSRRQRNEEFNNSFVFIEQDEEDAWGFANHIPFVKKRAESTTLDDKIARVRWERKKKEKEDLNIKAETQEFNSIQSSDENDGISSSEEDTKQDKVKLKDKKKNRRKKKGENKDTEKETLDYSEDITTYDENLTFQNMNLSRPLMKALSNMSFSHPTPIQSATIPIGLLGKDICACAVTGSGKTAAFMLPVLERLLYKPKSAPVTRVLVLVPTRELAVQVYTVSRQLAQHTHIEISLSAGGLDLKAQEAALRLGPDVVIATPGRLIDHVHNSPNFNLESIEVLILDEADRMLDEYFAEQMKEIIRLCSRMRQTMLFSATMTDEVKDLAAVSLKNPIRVFVNDSTDTALNLRQEFVRIRQSNEGDREAIISALVSRTFHERCIVFIQTKKQAHRMHIVLGLLGVNVGELHGNLSQTQRLEALKAFKDGQLDVLLATDVAARGLDIQNVKTVINFTMPATVKHYVHRVGRTARAGKSGRSVSLVGEKERKMLKEIVKKARNPVKSRIVPQDVIMKYRDKISKLGDDIKDVETQEVQEKLLRISEMQVNKAQNMMDPKKEESSRPERTWFQTQKERMKEKSKLSLNEYKKDKKSKKKMNTAEDRVQFELQKAAAYQARIAKRGHRPKRIRAYEEDDDRAQPKKSKKQKAKSSFEHELTNTSKKAVKQFRHGPSYQERKNISKKKSPFKSAKPKNKRR